MSKQSALAALSAAALLLAAGCSQDPASPGADATRPPAAVATQPCPEPAYTAMPDGIELGQPFLVRSDRIVATANGGERRRTWLEITEGDPRQVAEAIVADLLADGFQRLEARERDDGITRHAVHKRGVGRINISASSDLGAKPSHPRAVGLVGFDWPVAGGDEGPGEGEGLVDPAPGEAPDADPTGD